MDPVTTTVYHIETRSDGRSVIVHTTQGSDVFGAGWSARTGVEEVSMLVNSFCRGILIRFRSVWRCGRDRIQWLDILLQLLRQQSVLDHGSGC